jgi:hypothetical protein
MQRSRSSIKIERNVNALGDLQREGIGHERPLIQHIAGRPTDRRHCESPQKSIAVGHQERPSEAHPVGRAQRQHCIVEIVARVVQHAGAETMTAVARLEESNTAVSETIEQCISAYIFHLFAGMCELLDDGRANAQRIACVGVT